MGSIGLFFEDANNFIADISIGAAGIESDEGLETAIVLSLFSDARVTEEELPPTETSKRGYWGDMYSDIDGDHHGSKLWLFDREKQTLENLSKIEDTSKAALQWMIDDGIVKSIDVQASYPQAERVLIAIQATKPDGEIYAFKMLWDGQSAKRA